MPQVAKVSAISPRKTWITRLYLVTRSNIGSYKARWRSGRPHYSGLDRQSACGARCNRFGWIIELGRGCMEWLIAIGLIWLILRTWGDKRRIKELGERLRVLGERLGVLESQLDLVGRRDETSAHRLAPATPAPISTPREPPQPTPVRRPEPPAVLTPTPSPRP